MQRRTRTKAAVNYKELVDIKLPKRSRRTKSTSKVDELFPITIVERQESRVKVHYIGYSSIYDEWKDTNELEYLSDQQELQCEPLPSKPVRPFESFSLYHNLAVKIKQSLACQRRSSPSVKITTPFDLILYNGGLKEAGVPSKKVHGNQYYRINHYRDLNHLLGKNWHFRGINENGDYGYAVMGTIEFYLSKCRPIKDYIPLEDGTIQLSSVDPGYLLSFTFVCGYGTHESFGKDTQIFYK